MQVNKTILYVSLFLIVTILITRFISLWIPSLIIRFKRRIQLKTLFLLTWGGLRGGISIALALSIQPEFHKEIWVTITYAVVCFSVLVQGMTIGKLSKGALKT